MNRAESAELIKTIQHYVDGGEIENQHVDLLDTEWTWTAGPTWNLQRFRYRPHKRSGECEAAIDIEGRLVSNPGGSGPSGTFRIKWEEISESG